jgi:small-conductance mechanosensitive channel
VERIGIRSSTLRTFEGAEVIVPNAQLVGDRITNWTLSDNRRRISLTLAVDANEDPSRVLALLLEVARSDPRVASQPFPEALLVRLAGSQLEVELRAWTEDPNWMRVRSDLAIAVHAALKPAR